MDDNIIAPYDLGQVVDTRTMEEIHRTVVSALEKDLYRTHVGNFEVRDARGHFAVGGFTEGRRVLLVPDSIERYELHVDPKGEEVPGAVKGVDGVGIIYDVTVADGLFKRGFEVSFHYPHKKGDESGSSYGFFGFDLINRKMDYNNPEQGNINWKTLQWIYDQLKV